MHHHQSATGVPGRRRRAVQGSPLSAVGGDRWLARLTGVRTSKRNYYPEYRRTSQGLGRALAALEAISGALCMTTGGARSLIAAFLEAIGAQFSPALALIVLRPGAFGGTVPALLGRDADGRLIDDEAGLPAAARGFAALLRWHGAAEPPPGWLVTPMRRGDEPVGALAVWHAAGEPDDTDVVILAALASQAVTAVDNACLYTESEQLRARIAAVYREAEHHARDLEERSAQLRTVQRHLTEARERQLVTLERERIARELHDSVAQHLLSIGMHLEWCRPLAAPTPALRERLDLAKGLARAAVGHIRDAIFALSTVGAQGGSALAGALDELAVATIGMSRIPVQVTLSGELPPLEPAVEHGLHRIAQEAVANAARHAAASRIRITLRSADGSVVLLVSDDGTGDAAALRRHLRAEQSGRHRGLHNMAARASELDGTLAIARVRGGGVAIRATVPVGCEGWAASQTPPVGRALR